MDAVRNAGGVPIILPVGGADLRELIHFIDGIIFSGGGDIDPNWYGGDSHSTNYNIDPERDRFELALMNIVLKSKLPTLCICRGTQILNIVLGGNLIPHIPDVFGETVFHRTPDRKPVDHMIKIRPKSFLAIIMNKKVRNVKSWHHQSLDKLGKGLNAVAWSDDGVVEAVELKKNELLLAVQWHPELNAAENPLENHLFLDLVKKAKKS